MRSDPTPFGNADYALKNFARRLTDDGEPVPTRQGGTTSELLHQSFALVRPWERYVTLRKVSLPAQVAETLWVLSGRNDIEWLSRYLPRASEFSDDGKTWRAGYGPRLRGAYTQGPDPLLSVLRILREDPSSRRAVISLWDSTNDYQNSKDVPCNNWLHFMIRDGELHTHVVTRSNDLVWGWSGINQFEWSVLHEIIAATLGVRQGPVHYTIGSLHAYPRHRDLLDRIGRTPMERGRYTTGPGEAMEFDTGAGSLDDQLYRLRSLEELAFQRASSHPGYVAGVIDGAALCPMFKSFARILAARWSPDPAFRALPSDVLAVLEASPGVPTTTAQPLQLHTTEETPEPTANPLVDAGDPDQLIDAIRQLHVDKDRAYGDSWCKRGETLGILANIARKVDRLGAGDGGGETDLDTAVDLLVYLAKYRIWLAREREEASLWMSNRKLAHPKADVNAANRLIRVVQKAATPEKDFNADQCLVEVREFFNRLEARVYGHDAALNQDRHPLVERMLTEAWLLVLHYWQAAKQEQWKSRNSVRSWAGYEQ